MEDIDLLDSEAKPDHFNGKREPFLTTICILSFVGCGIGIIGSVFMFYTYNSFDKALIGLDAELKETGIGGFNALKWKSLFDLVSNLLCLTGAILMFNLKKAGFVIYLVGHIVPLSLVFIFGSPGSFWGGSSIIWQMIGFIPAIAFIAMYAVNLKRMR